MSNPAFDGLCGIIPTFASSDLQIRCNYELGHAGPCCFKKHRRNFVISCGCGPNPEWARERGFIDSVINHKK